MKKPTICFDLDGTLANYDDGWQGIEVIGKPLARGCKLLRAASKYCKIIIFTCRANMSLNKGHTIDEVRQIIANWLITNNLPFDEIYFGQGKPIADAYVDDRAVEFNENSNVDFAITKLERLTGVVMYK